MRLVILMVLISIFLKAPYVSYFDRTDPVINLSEILPQTSSLLILIQAPLQRVTSVKSPEALSCSISSHAANIWCLKAAGKTLCSSFLDGKHFPLPTAFCKTVQSLLPAFRELLATGKCLWKEWAGRHPNSRSHKIPNYISPSSSFFPECWE